MKLTRKSVKAPNVIPNSYVVEIETEDKSSSFHKMSAIGFLAHKNEASLESILKVLQAMANLKNPELYREIAGFREWFEDDSRQQESELLLAVRALREATAILTVYLDIDPADNLFWPRASSDSERLASLKSHAVYYYDENFVKFEVEVSEL